MNSCGNWIANFRLHVCRRWQLPDSGVRLIDLRIRHHPQYWMATVVASMNYANFFTHRYIPDYRWSIWRWKRKLIS